MKNQKIAMVTGATIVWLATDPPHDLTGKFVKDQRVIPW